MKTIKASVFLAGLLLVAGCLDSNNGSDSGTDPHQVMSFPAFCGQENNSSFVLVGSEATAVDTSEHSVARYWNEVLLDLVRMDLPYPTVHSRNLFHVSAGMYDAWAAYHEEPLGLFQQEKVTGASFASDSASVNISVAFTAYRIARHRYQHAEFPEQTMTFVDDAMVAMGMNPCYAEVGSGDPAAFGNQIAYTILTETLDDGANERNDYENPDNLSLANPPLEVAQADIQMPEPDRFQLLILEEMVTQNQIPQGDKLQTYVGPHWRQVQPFAISREGAATYFDPPGFPAWNSPQMTDWIKLVITRTSYLDKTDNTSIDISPGTRGNNPLGSNDGAGHALNPATGAPYPQNRVMRSDFGRVVAEFWADGPDTETPPGHWNTIANDVSDKLYGATRIGGAGEYTSKLEWDVKLYLALNGALHDAAIGAWETKRHYMSARPISLIRYRASLGQSADPLLPSYHPDGLPLMPGLIELVTEASSAPGARHAHLKAYRGELALKGWLGPFGYSAEEANIGWIRARLWQPYQPVTFVTPAFPGYVSGHSTFSRAAAEVLALATGSEFFPGGIMTYDIPAGTGLGFEPGPEADVQLQWATYFDASDESGDSRLWGGIHIAPDDYEGRKIGSEVGQSAWQKAMELFYPESGG